MPRTIGPELTDTLNEGFTALNAELAKLANEIEAFNRSTTRLVRVVEERGLMVRRA